MKITISGILKNGEGEILPNYSIELIASKTSKEVIKASDVIFTTDKEGYYQVDVYPCTYTVFISALSRYELGIIRVYSDSKSGSLNDFLIMPRACDLTPEILHIYNQIKKEIEEIAKTIKLFNPVLSVNTIKPDPSGNVTIKTNVKEEVPQDAPQDGNTYGRKNGEWVLINPCSCDTKIKTIDLTKVYNLSVWDYMERDEIQTFSDMMLDYLKSKGVTDYKADKFYVEYVPDLINSKIEINEINEDDIDWREIFAARGFVHEKIRTAHIIDKNTNAVVAKVNYIGGDDDDYLLTAHIDTIASEIVPIDPTDKDYYIRMVNYGLKNGVTLIEDGEEITVMNKLEPEKYLNLIGYPFDNKRLQLGLGYYTEDDEGKTAMFICSIDFPTGAFPAIHFPCMGSREWVFDSKATNS